MKPQAILKAMMDKSKLVLVERVRHDKSGDHITKKWVSASSVKHSDAVLKNAALLSKDHPALKNKPHHAVGKMPVHEAQKKAGQAAAKTNKPAAAKSGAAPVSGSTGAPAKPKPGKDKLVKMQAIMTPQEFEKYLSNRGMTVSDAQKIMSGQEDAAPKTPEKAAAKPAVSMAQINKWHKNFGSAEKTKVYIDKHGHTLTPIQQEYLNHLIAEEAKTSGADEPSAEQPKQTETAKESPAETTKPKEAGDTYAEKPPVNRANMKKLADSIGREEGPGLSKRQVSDILASVRSDADGQSLSDDIAATDNEKAYVRLLNSITDKDVLKKIAYTGIIPEDGEATKFMDEKMFRHYHAMKEEPAPRASAHVENTKLAENVRKYIGGASAMSVANAMTDMDMSGASYVFRMTYPAESTMILGSTTNGNRQTPANTDSMPFIQTDKTSPGKLFSVGKYFAASGKTEADGIRAMLDHIAQQEPSLAEECKVWKQEFDAVMEACGSDLDKMSKALNNTYDNVKDLFTKDEYNTIVGGVLKLYGASLTDGGDTAFEGDYSEMTAGDCIRMTYATTGTMERQAVMSNVMNAFYTTEVASRIYSSGSAQFSPSPGTAQAASANLDGIHVLSLDQFSVAQKYVDNTNDMPSAKEGNVHYTQAQRARIGNRDIEKDLFSTDDPSPMLDMFRGVIEGTASYSTKKPAAKIKGPQYDASMLKPVDPVLAAPDFGDDELLGLRTMAFQNAACSIKSVTGDAYAQIKEEVEYKEEGYSAWKKAGGTGTKGSNYFPEREIVMRGAYEIRNSKMAQAYTERLAADKAKGGGKTFDDPLYHGTGFGAAAAILHDGGFRTKGVKQASGNTLGRGVYIGKSTGKVVPYAATGGCYSAEWQELMYDGTNDYSHNDISDGIIFKMDVSKGMKSGKAASIGAASAKNKNNGGNCDIVECTGYKTWEAVAADSDLVNPTIMIDAGERFYDGKAAFSVIHNKNTQHLSGGPQYASKTNNKSGNSILDVYLKKLKNRAR